MSQCKDCSVNSGSRLLPTDDEIKRLETGAEYIYRYHGQSLCTSDPLVQV